jgi:hypothetical protein
VVAHDPERDRPMDDAVRGGWLGFAPASAEQVTAAERRLGCVLPPSLRSFLLMTDGWTYAGSFIYRLAGTAELAWLRDTTDAHWADAYDDDVVRRSLRLSLEGDASVLFLDPADVDQNGEWAAYRLASWSGTGPERHDSFADLMFDLYAGFHALRKPPGETRDRWDRELEQARLLALSGEVDGPAKVFAGAQRFGRERARLLRFQLCAMQGDWYTAPLSHLFSADLSVVDDPLFEAELLPLLFLEDRLTHHTGLFTLERLRQQGHAHVAIERHEARRREPGFRQPFGNADFDLAVRAVVDDLTAAVDPGEDGTGTVRRRASAHVVPCAVRVGPTIAQRQEAVRARRDRLDQAWPQVRAAMSAWRPVSDNHIAPVVLFTEPLLAEMITASRGRELLGIPRG